MTVERLANQVKWVLFSLDKEKIQQFAKSWGITLPKNDKDFWRVVYNSILEIPDAPKGVRLRAMNWLTINGKE
ncbi:MAG: hypothetical protein E7504_04175 [Ruminococcus sp.]|nr:hypothetical protein [Ruminococcus sp.]